MRLLKISIEGFRTIENLAIDIDDYTVLVGPNGIGKSAVLRATEWLICGDKLGRSDVHGLYEDDPCDAAGNQPSSKVRVTGEFGDLTDSDSARLGPYGRGERAVFTREWDTSQEKPKLFGNALAGPGFQAVRAMGKVGDFRPAYAALRKALPTLADLQGGFKKPEVEMALAQWESDPENASQLQAVDGAEVSHMLGIAGTGVLRDCFHVVFVPAGADAEREAGAASRGNLLDSLVGSIASATSDAHRLAWMDEHAALLTDYSEQVSKGVAIAVEARQARISSALAEYVPGAALELVPTIPDLINQATIGISTRLDLDGRKDELSRQGHGVQRAVIIALLQALAPDESLLRTDLIREEGEGDAAYEARLAAATAELPHVLFLMEEPEIYQHPVRARAFARVLSELSGTDRVQLMVATHSPYFVAPRQFESLRRLRREASGIEVTRTTVKDVALVSGAKEAGVSKFIDRYLPHDFSEGFFSDLVVLVEGQTDLAVIDPLAQMLGTPLDVSGASLFAVDSKTALKVPHHLLSELGVRTYVVVDGDCSGSRVHPENKSAREKLDKTHKVQTDDILAWLPHAGMAPRIGSLPYLFGDPTLVASNFTILRDDLEEELAQWPSFMRALAAEGGALRQKNPSIYRAATLAADTKDVPANLKALVAAVVAASN